MIPANLETLARNKGYTNIAIHFSPDGVTVRIWGETVSARAWKMKSLGTALGRVAREMMGIDSQKKD